MDFFVFREIKKLYVTEDDNVTQEDINSLFSISIL